MGTSISANIPTTTVSYPIVLSSYPMGGCVSGGIRSFYSGNLDKDCLYIHAGYWLSDGTVSGHIDTPTTYIFAMIFGIIT